VLNDALSADNVGRTPRVPVGIDLALTCTGIAYRQPNGKVCTRSIKTKVDGKYNHRVQTERLVTITTMLCDILNDLPWDLDVVIEAPAYGARGRGAVDVAQLHGAVRAGLVLNCRLFPLYAEALTVRRIVLGTGYKKKDAAEKVRKAFNLDFPTPDECDAYLIMRAAEIAHDPVGQWPQDVTYLVKQLHARNG